MPALTLTPAQRREYRALAHHLNPVILIGADGLTDAVMRETDQALRAHGLIKVRVQNDERTEREAMLTRLTETLSAAAVQHIGKLLVLWRPKPTKARVVDEDRQPGPRTARVLRFNAPGQKPEIKNVTVLGNQRLTAGGLVKRAKRRTVSVKKRGGTN